MIWHQEITCRGHRFRRTTRGMELTCTSHADLSGVKRRKDPQKSGITNGTRLLPGIDGRSPWVRRCKDIIAAHVSDLGGVRTE